MGLASESYLDLRVHCGEIARLAAYNTTVLLTNVLLSTDDDSLSALLFAHRDLEEIENACMHRTFLETYAEERTRASTSTQTLT